MKKTKRIFTETTANIVIKGSDTVFVTDGLRAYTHSL